MSKGEILKLLRLGNYLSLAEIVRMSGLGKSAVARHLHKLKDDGKVVNRRDKVTTLRWKLK